MRFESGKKVLKQYVKGGNKINIAGTALSHYCRHKRIQDFLNAANDGSAAAARESTLCDPDMDLLLLTAAVLKLPPRAHVELLF